MHSHPKMETQQEKREQWNVLGIDEGMTPENWLSHEEQGCANRGLLSHPSGGQMIKRPHAKQEHNEVDKVLDIHWLQAWKDLFSRLFEEGCEHHESRTIIFK